MDLPPITLPLVERSVTKIELDEETLIIGRSKLEGSCAIEQVSYLTLHTMQ